MRPPPQKCSQQPERRFPHRRRGFDRSFFGGWETAAPSNRQSRAAQSAGAFTLVELIVVMVLLLIVASMVAPRMSSFFQGRALSQEARRMLSLANYAQTRAVAEGVPVLLWIDTKNSTYGLEVQGGHHSADDRTTIYTAEPSLTLETSTNTDIVASELDDERLGMADDLPAIRFNPDGFFDEVSVSKIVIRQGTDGALEIVPTANRLGHEIRPASISN